MKERPMPTTRKLPRRRHPALANPPPGVWSPLAVGKLPGYPRTQEMHDVHKPVSSPTPREPMQPAGGIGQGFPPDSVSSARSSQSCAIKCTVDAWKVTEALWGNSLTPEERLAPEACTTDEARAAVALAVIVSIPLDHSETTALRLAAMRSILEYTMPRPKRGHSVALPDGLVWLNGLIEVVPSGWLSRTLRGGKRSSKTDKALISEADFGPGWVRV